MDLFYPHPGLPYFLKDLSLLSTHLFIIFSLVIVTWQGVTLTIMYVTPVACLSPLFHVCRPCTMSLSPSLAPPTQYQVDHDERTLKESITGQWMVPLSYLNVQTLLMYHMAKEPWPVEDQCFHSWPPSYVMTEWPWPVSHNDNVTHSMSDSICLSLSYDTRYMTHVIGCWLTKPVNL